MYTVLIMKKDDNKELQKRDFQDNQAKAEKYFNLLKEDISSHSREDLFDATEGIKYSDIRLLLFKDDEEISRFNK